MTVKSQTATLVTGDPPGDFTYALTLLPTAAPALGQYSTPLPITLSAIVPDQSTVAGKYTVQASATGYAPKSSLSPVDISVGDATNQDIALTP